MPRIKNKFTIASGTTAVAFIALMPFLSVAQAPSQDWKAMNKETLALYQKGDTKAALALGEKDR